MLAFGSKYLLIPFLISLHVISGVVICIFVIHFSRHSKTHCNPSSCGSIDSISFPFRLNTDPKHCGNPNYELTCEKNQTVLTLHYSQKYYVQSINYDDYTIRVVDPDVQETNNMCSFPRYAIAWYNFAVVKEHNFFGYHGSYPYSISRVKRSQYSWERLPPIPLITVPIIFLRCPFPVKSSTFVETTQECWNNKSRSGRNNNAPFYPSAGHSYVKLGTLNASDFRISCQVELITMTSWRIQENDVYSQINISLLEIYDALAYGFELSWFQSVCDQNCRWSGECELDDTTNEITCWNNYGKNEPITEMDQEQSSMPESSESIAILPNSANSNSIGIIVD
nr:rust resistance kinase Lr10-like isoform X1 [Ipomoea batatas]